ncbi:MAG TPA: hypothetical protein VNQ53_11640 [Nocardioides sp.]|nr:hypothetical protein [Nocardioides sp.]
MIAFVGYLAAVIDIGQFTPQTWRTVRRRRDAVAMSGISVTAYTIATAQAVLWVVYGFATDRLPIALPNLLIAPACATVLLLGVASRRRGRAEDSRDLTSS